MSELNPNNYDGVTVAPVVGRAGGPFEIKTFSNGGEQAQLSIAVSKGYRKDDAWVDTGTDWYTLTAQAKYAQENWPDVEAGDKVRVDESRLELKPFTRNNGDAAVEATLRYGSLVIVDKKGAGKDVKPF